MRSQNENKYLVNLAPKLSDFTLKILSPLHMHQNTQNVIKWVYWFILGKKILKVSQSCLTGRTYKLLLD